jgi:acyl CoA:acetate/3-ketoacid CoA transferase beta subunit
VNEVVTDLGYFKIGDDGLKLVEIAPDVTVDEIRERTGCDFAVADPLPVMDV